MQKTEISYLAGLIDGEGTITLSRKSKNQHRTIVVSIANNDLQLLGWVKKITGLGCIIQKTHSNINWKASYTWSVCGRQALNLLDQVHLYLKTYKKKRAKLILKYYLQVTPRNGRYSKIMLDNKLAFEDMVLSIQK